MHDLDAPSTDVSPVEVRRAAMNLLARREHSFIELIEKLSRRFPDRDFLSSSLRVLTEQNLQSDERFAESFINARMLPCRGITYHRAAELSKTPPRHDVRLYPYVHLTFPFRPLT